MDPIGPATRVGSLLELHPGIVEVFASFHVGDTRGARLPREMSVAEVAAQWAIPLDMLVIALRGWVEENA